MVKAYPVTLQIGLKALVISTLVGLIMGVVVALKLVNIHNRYDGLLILD